MVLKEGNLDRLVTKVLQGAEERIIRNTVWVVLRDILRALDFLASQGIIHQDVKPANILYMPSDDEMAPYKFQLADFGLSSRRADNANVPCGTPLFRAPEMRITAVKTDKVDIWSLFVTAIWALDIQGYRQEQAACQDERKNLEAVLSRRGHSDVGMIGEMARENAEDRASAAQMILKLYGGDGLTTPIGQIESLPLPPSSGPSRVAVTSPEQMMPPPRRRGSLIQSCSSTPVRSRSMTPEGGDTMRPPPR
jgi:serine/threonine protein kinase